MAWFIVLRVVLSVSANAVQKRLLIDRAGTYHTWILTYAIILGPAVAIASFRPVPPTAGFWLDIAIGGALDAIGNLAMVAALRLTDVSVFGPLNALRPIIALLFGWIFLGELPTTLGFLGVAITVFGGVILLSDSGKKGTIPSAGTLRPLILRVSGLSLGVAGAVFLKRAALASTAEATVAAWIFFGLIVLGVTAVLHRPGDLLTLKEAGRAHARWILVHATIFLTMQWLTIRIFQQTLLAYSFVYFQLGMVLQVFVGRILFNEPAFLRRLVASVIMAIGSILVLIKG